jgi:LPS export ABC transporter protein LptC
MNQNPLKISLFIGYYKFALLFVMSMMLSCSNNTSDIDSLLNDDLQANIERGKNIRIIYSDSAVIRMIIHAPVMERHIHFRDTKDVFPKGILIEFLDENKKVNSTLKADSAVRENNSAKVTAKGNVIFQNDKGEKLETPELIWDENERIVYTEKIVRITQAEKGDTTYGFGFKANQEFNRFEIKKKVQGKINVTNFLN